MTHKGGDGGAHRTVATEDKIQKAIHKDTTRLCQGNNICWYRLHRFYHFKKSTVLLRLVFITYT